MARILKRASRRGCTVCSSLIRMERRIRYLRTVIDSYEKDKPRVQREMIRLVGRLRLAQSQITELRASLKETTIEPEIIGGDEDRFIDPDAVVTRGILDDATS